MSSAINRQPVVYVGAIQSTSFRYVVTPYLRISALPSIQVMFLCCLPTYSSKRGPWRSVLYLSSIAVSVLACLVPLCRGLLIVTVVNIYTFYKHQSQCRQVISSSSESGFSRSRYLRLMAISSVEVFGTIPLATFFIVSSAKMGIVPWKSWADTHKHYSAVYQMPSFIWKNTPEVAMRLETYRWSLVACAFIFFALFGFAVEAREQYYRLYKLLARCIGYSTSAPQGASHVCVSLARSLFWHVPIHKRLHYFVFSVSYQCLM